MFLATALSRRSIGRLVLASLLVPWCGTSLRAQEPAPAATDSQTIALLMKRIDALEARVRQLEADRGETPVAAATLAEPVAATPDSAGAMAASKPAPAAAAQHSPAETDTPAPESSMTERMDLGRTLLRIRGFGDVSLHGDTYKGDTTSFSLGQLDLFITSDVSDKFKFLSEVVFEGGPDNIYGVNVGEANTFGVDIERYVLQYSPNDWFNLSAGRQHTAIGYYNTAYHHSTWLQTTTDRPFLFEFEDRGGILPIHMVGASATGLLPVGSLGLHYIAEVGNGRASRNPLLEEPVQNEIDDENGKAFNLGFFARPEALEGLQFGFSLYRDRLAPTGLPKIGELIPAVHAVLIRPKFEWLNEALLVRHAVAGTSNVFHTPAFYSQVSRQFGSYRPYLRYEYMNVPAGEPIFPDLTLRYGPSVGIRYDASESVALKFQYDSTALRGQPAIDGLKMQLGFTF